MNNSTPARPPGCAPALPPLPEPEPGSELALHPWTCGFLRELLALRTTDAATLNRVMAEERQELDRAETVLTPFVDAMYQAEETGDRAAFELAKAHFLTMLFHTVEAAGLRIRAARCGEAGQEGAAR